MSSPKNRVSGKHNLLLSTLKVFYKDKRNLDQFLPIVLGKSRLSLRLIDWFCTNYAKDFGTIYQVEKAVNGETKQTHLMVHRAYKSMLRGYAKTCFDPFCRGETINFHYEVGKNLVTTVGQLNFFRWAITNKVLDYIHEHLREIEPTVPACTKTPPCISEEEHHETAAASSSEQAEASSSAVDSRVVLPKRSLANVYLFRRQERSLVTFLNLRSPFSRLQKHSLEQVQAYYGRTAAGRRVRRQIL